MTKIDIDKFVASLMEFCPQQSMKYIKALADQGLMYKDGEIVDLNGTDQDGGVKGENGEQGMTEFEQAIERLIKEFAGDPDFKTPTEIAKGCSKELLNIARKQFEGNPEFLYTVTRKAAEMARKHFLDKACEWWKNYAIDNNAFQGRLYRFEIIDGIVRQFRKYMEEKP